MSSKSFNTFSLFPFKSDYLNRVDPRIVPFLTGWKVIQQYKGQTVHIPPTWNSSVDVVKYFQVVKKENDPNNKEEENEIGATLWAGWTGYDHEVEVNLFIQGKNVLSGKRHVSAEIIKCGGAKMTVFHNDKLMTNFSERDWWHGIKKVDKVWVDRL